MSFFFFQNSDEKHVSLLLQARGPGKCGLMIDVLTTNPLRSKPELKTILKKNEYDILVFKMYIKSIVV